MSFDTFMKVEGIEGESVDVEHKGGRVIILPL